MSENDRSEPWDSDDTESLMTQASQRIVELDAERDDFHDRWLKAEAECTKLRRELQKLQAMK